MGRVVNTWAASVGLDGADFLQWLKGFGRKIQRPQLDQSVTFPAEPTPSALDLWRAAVIAGREAKKRHDTRGQHAAEERAKQYLEAQLRGAQ
jgi:hypothetical protein